ncbi:hypothetical protein QE152_g11154 [Popillia japonica]|uniref:Ribosomal protein S7 n=1 Tax=Popillia japonica TaxID=7064 RepID=A0AAW1LSD0_POPJA
MKRNFDSYLNKVQPRRKAITAILLRKLRSPSSQESYYRNSAEKIAKSIIRDVIKNLYKVGVKTSGDTRDVKYEECANVVLTTADQKLILVT